MNASPASPDNQAIRELRDTTRDLNETLKKAIKSNDKFSYVFAAFGLVQIFFGIGQLAIAALSTNTYRIQIILVAVGVVIAGHIFLVRVFKRKI